MFIDWLLEEMNRRNWTQAELARRSGLTKAAVSKIVSGQRTPSPETCQAIADAFHIPQEIVLRKAGHLDPKPETDELAEKILHIYSLLDDDRQIELRNYAEYQLQLQEQRGNHEAKAGGNPHTSRSSA